VRGGRATIAIAIIVLPTLAAGRSSGRTWIDLAIVAVVTALGVVSWLVTRWQVDGDGLRIETGLVRRRSVRFPLVQVQAIDIVRPGLARMFDLAELRLRMGGSTAGTARLAYLHAQEAERLRGRLLELARGAGRAEEVSATARPEGRELTVVPTGRLITSILISDVGVLAEAVLAALIVTAVLSPAAAVAVASGGAVWILSAVTLVWRRFNQEYRLRVSDAPEGLQLAGGLIALTAETIRPGRVQAVRLVEPFLWRRLGWCRLEVDIAGRQRSKGEGQAQRRPLRAVLPVGTHAEAERLLERIVPRRPLPELRAPRRVRWKSPLRYRMLAWGRSDACVSARSGRLRRVTSWVPLEKVQSFRRVQGPVQRRFGLASIHVDTAGRNTHATLRDRDVTEADDALADLAALARRRRTGGR
jgi:putative membrane protein